MLKKFWQNLGMTHSEIQSLPSYTSDILSEIMSLEERHQQKELINQSKRGQSAQRKSYKR